MKAPSRVAGRLALATLALPFVSSAVACSGAATEPFVDVGSGRQRYRPLDDGDAIAFHQGPQGGWHLYVSLRAGGLAPAGAKLTLERWLEARGPSDRDWKQTSYIETDLSPVSGEPLVELVGWLTVLSQPECYLGRRLHIAVQIEDRRGRVAEADRIVVPSPGPEGGPTLSCDAL
jgi:hypothetical protein